MSKTPNGENEAETKEIQGLVQENKRLLQKLKECRHTNSELQNEKASLMTAL